MTKLNSSSEKQIKDRMSRAYKAQELHSDGWNDWGNYTAHVVNNLLQEIESLREALERAGAQMPEKREPFPA